MNCPRRSLAMSPALSRMDRCFEMDGFEISKRSAISPAVRSVADRYARILRRTVEDSASKTLSRDIGYLLVFRLLTNYLTTLEYLANELTIKQKVAGETYERQPDETRRGERRPLSGRLAQVDRDNRSSHRRGRVGRGALRLERRHVARGPHPRATLLHVGSIRRIRWAARGDHVYGPFRRLSQAVDSSDVSVFEAARAPARLVRDAGGDAGAVLGHPLARCPRLGPAAAGLPPVPETRARALVGWPLESSLSSQARASAGVRSGPGDRRRPVLSIPAKDVDVAA